MAVAARPTPQPWQVWWADLDPTVGREQAGRRPVLVIASPLHARMFGRAVTVVLPMTTTENPNFRNRVHVAVPGMGAGAGWVITEQPRTISVNRLRGRPIATIAETEQRKIQQVLRELIAI